MKSTITIAGGGLAGLALGLVLRRRGVPVRVVEAAAYPRHRVCGEFISGISGEELVELGVEDLFEHAQKHTTTAWFEGERTLLRRELPAAAHGLSRYFLDAALAQRFVELGGELVCGQRWSEEGEGVVWAAGRVQRPSPWIGLKAHFEGLELSADLEIHVQNSGYVGLTRVEEGRVNVCGLFRRDEALSRGGLVIACEQAGLPGLAERLRSAKMVEGSLKGVTHFSLGWQQAAAGRVCVGDSAAMIPPFTGNGMSMALQSALVAAEPLAAWSAGESSWTHAGREVRGRLRQRFGRRLRWARWMQTLLLSRAGRRLALGLLTSGLVRFETLYDKVR